MKDFFTIQDKIKQTVAIVVRNEYKDEGITFFTPDDFSQQMAYMHHPKGHVIDSHVHNPVKREVHFTREVLVVRKGLLRCDLFDDEQNYIETVDLRAGDIILLAAGGHGFECMEDTEFFEIKQGPYSGEGDKTRFRNEVQERIIRE